MNTHKQKAELSSEQDYFDAFRATHSKLSEAQVTLFNYLQSDTIERYEVWGLGDSFEEFTGLSLDKQLYLNAEIARRIPTSELFKSENEESQTLVELEEAAGILMEDGASMGRHLAASIIEAIVDGDTPSRIPILVRAVARLGVNSRDDWFFSETLRGVADTMSNPQLIGKDVAEVILRAAIDCGKVGHWPVDMIRAAPLVVGRDKPEGGDRDTLSSYMFGVALGVSVDDFVKEAVITHHL